MNVIIAGTISNVSRTIHRELITISKALSAFEIVEIILIESDSSDNTNEIVKLMQNQFENIVLISLGSLAKKIPNRIARIRHCRQKYVERIRKVMEMTPVDYVVIADLDGMNGKINASSVSSCFTRTDWAGVLANQKGGYYDLFALRHDSWCPGNIFEELNYLKSKLSPMDSRRFNYWKRIERRLEYDRIRKNAIYSKMRRIPRNSPWVEVDSGFGGFAIYRAELFRLFDYGLMEFEHEGSSEHVSFCGKVRLSGGRLFINPNLINNHWNTYNINRFFIIRQLREIYWNLAFRQVPTKN